MSWKPLANFVVFSLTLVLTAPLQSEAAAAQPENSYIVVWNDDVDSDLETDDFEKRENAQADFRYSHALKGFAAKLNAGQLAKLQRNPKVKFISEDREVQAVGEIAAGDSAPTGVRRIEAATATTAKESSTVAVAVIDTGIQLNHPDINALSGKNCVKSRRTPNDDNGHGTHVAGSIAAKNNGSGVVGVTPGTTLYSVKVLNSSGSGSWSSVICGIDWVTGTRTDLDSSNDIAVANMSLGGSGSDDGNCGNSNGDALHKAICRSVGVGVTYAVAAGNSGADLKTFVPAAYDEVLTVTAVSDSDGEPGGGGGAPTCRTGEQDDRYATFSNYATLAVDQAHTIAAPGVCIFSTWKGGVYNTISGTSMAAPHVAGTAALCISSAACGGAPSQIIAKLRTDAATRSGTAIPTGYGFSGDPNSPSGSRYYGYLVYAGGY